MTTTDEAIGQRLRQARNRKGLSIDDAAKLIDIEPATWSSWEAGHVVPLINGVRAALALGVEPEWLVEGD